MTESTELTVLVDDTTVSLDMYEGDQLTAVACELEKLKFDVNVAWPTILVNGKQVSKWDVVDFTKSYKFGKY